MKAKWSKLIHVIFTTQKEMYPLAHINNVQIPQEEEAKYLGLYLDKRFTWHKHIFTKWNHPLQNVLVTQMQVKTPYKQQTSHI
jgi:hypothetical protein